MYEVHKLRTRISQAGTEIAFGFLNTRQLRSNCAGCLVTASWKAEKDG